MKEMRVNNSEMSMIKYSFIDKYHLRRGSAKQSVNDGQGSLWQHGNFNTSQLRNLLRYNDETMHV